MLTPAESRRRPGPQSCRLVRAVSPRIRARTRVRRASCERARTDVNDRGCHRLRDKGGSTVIRIASAVAGARSRVSQVDPGGLVTGWGEQVRWVR